MDQIEKLDLMWFSFFRDFLRMGVSSTPILAQHMLRIVTLHSVYLFRAWAHLVLFLRGTPPSDGWALHVSPQASNHRRRAPRVSHLKATASIFIGRHDPWPHLPHSPATVARVGIRRRPHRQGSATAQVTRDLLPPAVRIDGPRGGWIGLSFC
jgi:hypothetical protein